MRVPRRVRVNLSITMQTPSNPRPSSNNDRNGEPPDGRIITKALEICFRNVWIRLMTSGVGQEYNDAIKAFVVACVAAYKAGYSLTALKFELAANESAITQSNVMGRDVSLTEQEKETRIIWISLVYITLAKFGFVSERTPPPIRNDLKGTKLESLIDGLEGLVVSVCDAAKQGYNLESWKMELNLKKDPSGKEITPGEASIRSQWSRIVFSTVDILPEELKQK